MLTASAFELLHVDPVAVVDDLLDSGASQGASRDDGPDKLLEDIRSRLNCEGRLMFRRIDITFEEGHVVLRGSVRTWFEKQLAQHLAMQAPGVGRIVNHLIVDADRSRETMLETRSLSRR